MKKEPHQATRRDGESHPSSRRTSPANRGASSSSRVNIGLLSTTNCWVKWASEPPPSSRARASARMRRSRGGGNAARMCKKPNARHCASRCSSSRSPPSGPAAVSTTPTRPTPLVGHPAVTTAPPAVRCRCCCSRRSRFVAAQGSRGQTIYRARPVTYSMSPPWPGQAPTPPACVTRALSCW